MARSNFSVRRGERSIRDINRVCRGTPGSAEVLSYYGDAQNESEDKARELPIKRFVHRPCDLQHDYEVDTR